MVNCSFKLLNEVTATKSYNMQPGGNPFAVDHKSDFTNRFGDCDFILAVCTPFLCNSDRFEVIRDFRSLNHGGNPFPVDESIAQQK
jgi:hypothetical protein